MDNSKEELTPWQQQWKGKQLMVEPYIADRQHGARLRLVDEDKLIFEAVFYDKYDTKSPKHDPDYPTWGDLRASGAFNDLVTVQITNRSEEYTKVILPDSKPVIWQDFAPYLADVIENNIETARKYISHNQQKNQEEIMDNEYSIEKIAKNLVCPEVGSDNINKAMTNGILWYDSELAKKTIASSLNFARELSEKFGFPVSDDKLCYAWAKAITESQDDTLLRTFMHDKVDHFNVRYSQKKGSTRMMDIIMKSINVIEAYAERCIKIEREKFSTQFTEEQIDRFCAYSLGECDCINKFDNNKLDNNKFDDVLSLYGIKRVERVVNSMVVDYMLHYDVIVVQNKNGELEYYDSVGDNSLSIPQTMFASDLKGNKEVDSMWREYDNFVCYDSRCISNIFDMYINGDIKPIESTCASEVLFHMIKTIDKKLQNHDRMDTNYRDNDDFER